MAESASIFGMIAAIKHAFDIIKAVKDADYDLDKSILKEKIAILIDSLLEAKIQANETLDTIQEKDKRIIELEELLKFKAN
jgi:Mg2+ and Co2+ transporter CorA